MTRFVILIVCAVLSAMTGAPAVAADGKLVYVVRFADYQDGPVEDWLRAKGFDFQRDATRRDMIDLDVGKPGLTIDVKRRAFGFMPNEAVNVPDFTFIEVDWGVNRHPEGASYEQGVRNEAIMLHVFMGDERQPSGSMFIPDTPYFIGLFVCSEEDRQNHPYVGRYFQKGGRYVCTDRPPPGAMVTSRFDLLQAYRDYFDKEGDDDPGISGIALAVDTGKAQGRGESSAFIREIRFFR